MGNVATRGTAGGWLASRLTPRAFQQARPADSRVRPLPYPFRGALAVSWDIEFTSFALFEILMRFFNTRGQTELGPGLGLEVCSSLFFYSAQPYTFSYFAGPGANAGPGPQAARLDEYLRAGWIDTNHAYGDFDFTGGCTREHARRACDTLGRLGVRLPVFTNHGSQDNVQNIGRDAAYHQGDVPDSGAYHMDLTRASGVRFVWTDSLKTEPLPPCGAREMAYAAANRVLALTMPGLRGPSEVLRTVLLNDGTRVNGFIRLRGTGSNAPNWTNLGAQFGALDLERLYSQDGVVVLYQHLGVLSRPEGQCRAATLEALAADGGALLAPWRLLAAEAEAGRMWVAGTGRLLGYLEAMAAAQVTKAGPGVYDLDGGAEPDDLGGLTVYVDEPDAVLRHGGRVLDVVHNGPDHTGRRSVSVPVATREDIWS